MNVKPRRRKKRKGGGFSWSSYWTPQYQAVLDAMAVEPSDFDKLHQAKMLKALVDEGFYAKAEFLDFFFTHTGGSLVNWRNPGTHNPELISTPHFEPYVGYRGASGKVVNLKFTPSTDVIVSSLNNACYIIAVGDDRIGTEDDFGGYGASGFGRTTIRSTYTDGNSYYRHHANTLVSRANTDTIKYYAMSRSAAGNVDIYINKIKTNSAMSSQNLANVELYACGLNINGTIGYTERVIRFACMFSFLTETEIGRFIDIMEEYQRVYHTNIIGRGPHLSYPHLDTMAIVPLTTYDGSGQTVHPSVLDLGFDWNGYRYWQVNTPYPNDNAALENPSIWASADGVSWVVPAGVTNPVVAGNAGVIINSDPDLYFEDGVMYIVWRELSGGIYRLLMTKSTDAINWSSHETLVTTYQSVGDTFCPCLLKIGAKYYLYHGYKDQSTLAYSVRRFSCDTINGTYANPETISLVSDEAGLIWWHFDFYYHNGFIYFIGSRILPGSSGDRIYIAKSNDGVNFTKDRFAVSNNSYSRVTLLGINSGLYRPCLSTIDNQTVMYSSYRTANIGYGLFMMNVDLY